jgi:hypothetical protein
MCKKTALHCTCFKLAEDVCTLEKLVFLNIEERHTAAVGIRCDSLTYMECWVVPPKPKHSGNQDDMAAGACLIVPFWMKTQKLMDSTLFLQYLDITVLRNYKAHAEFRGWKMSA